MTTERQDIAHALTASTTFNIFENKRKIERMSKQNLNPFKPFRHAFDFLSTCVNMLKREWQTVSTLLFDKIECIHVEANVETVCTGLKSIGHLLILHLKVFCYLCTVNVIFHMEKENKII